MGSYITYSIFSVTPQVLLTLDSVKAFKYQINNKRFQITKEEFFISIIIKYIKWNGVIKIKNKDDQIKKVLFKYHQMAVSEGRR